MQVIKKGVLIDAEVIIFNGNKNIVLKEGKIQFEIHGNKKVIPLYSKGRFIPFKMEYKGEYFQSYVIGKNKRINAIGYVLDDISDDEIIRAVENDEIEIVDGDAVSDIILFFFE